MNAGDDEERAIERRTYGCAVLVWTAWCIAVGAGLALAAVALAY